MSKLISRATLLGAILGALILVPSAVAATPKAGMMPDHLPVLTADTDIVQIKDERRKKANRKKRRAQRDHGQRPRVKRKNRRAKAGNRAPKVYHGSQRPRVQHNRPRTKVYRDDRRPKVRRSGDRQRAQRDHRRPKVYQDHRRPKVRRNGDRYRAQRDHRHPKVYHDHRRPKVRHSHKRPRVRRYYDRPIIIYRPYPPRQYRPVYRPYRYSRGEQIVDYVTILDPHVYGLTYYDRYVINNGYVYAVDPNTLAVLALIGLASALLN